MKKVLWMLSCGLLLTSGTVMAQMGGEEEPGMEDDIKAEVDAIFEEADGNKDGKISKAELKTAVKAMGEWEDETDVNFLTEYGSALVEFLASDADDNLEVTKDELTKFYAAQWEGEEGLELSKKDWATLDAEYIQPTAKAIIKAVDTDGDGTASKEESKAAGGDDFDSYDTNGDGKIDAKELEGSLSKEIEDGYGVKRGDKTEATPEGDGDKEGEGDTKDGDEVDYYAIYKKVGNNWTHKSTTTMAGIDPMVSYVKYEVLEVSDEKAKVKMTSMDKDKNETFSNEFDMPFTTATTDGAEAEGEAPEPVDETITVTAGEFECVKTEHDASGTKTTVWMSKDHPGLLVKAVSKSETFESTTELEEWKEG